MMLLLHQKSWNEHHSFREAHQNSDSSTKATTVGLKISNVIYSGEGLATRDRKRNNEEGADKETTRKATKYENKPRQDKKVTI